MSKKRKPKARGPEPTKTPPRKTYVPPPKGVMRSPAARSLVEELSADMSKATWVFDSLSKGKWPEPFIERFKTAIREARDILDIPPDVRVLDEVYNTIMEEVVRRLVWQRDAEGAPLFFRIEGGARYEELCQTLLKCLKQAETPAPRREDGTLFGKPIPGLPIYGLSDQDLVRAVFAEVHRDQGANATFWEMVKRYRPLVAERWEEHVHVALKHLLADGRIRHYAEEGHPHLFRVHVREEANPQPDAPQPGSIPRDKPMSLWEIFTRYSREHAKGQTPGGYTYTNVRKKTRYRSWFPQPVGKRADHKNSPKVYNYTSVVEALVEHPTRGSR